MLARLITPQAIQLDLRQRFVNVCIENSLFLVAIHVLVIDVINRFRQHPYLRLLSKQAL